MRRLRRWYIPACRGQRGPAGRASPQAGVGAGLRAGARWGRRRPAARIAAAVYVSPELYSLPVSQEFASLRPPLGGRTRLVRYKSKKKLKTTTTAASHGIFCTAVFETVKYLQGKYPYKKLVKTASNKVSCDQ